jgi:hypothetical protein
VDPIIGSSNIDWLPMTYNISHMTYFLGHMTYFIH